MTPQTLFFFVHLDAEEIPPYVFWEAETRVFIHAPNTCPPVLSDNFVIVKPQQHLRATVSLTEFTRLPAPYPSRCVDPEDNEWRDWNPFYFNESSFLYTKEQCEMKYYEDLITEKENCSAGNLPIQHKLENLCSWFMKPLYERDFSGCPLSCHELQYDWKPIITPLESKLMEKYQFYIFIQHHMSKLQMHISEEEYLHLVLQNFTQYFQGVSLLEFSPAPIWYMSYSEKPKYKLGDLLGAIGGNLGLWIGISLITFIEVFDFLMNLIIRSLKLLWEKICSKKRKSSLGGKNPV